MIPKNFRENINIAPVIDGLDRRNELAEDIIRKGTHLPRGVMLEDIDKSVIEFLRDELSIVINGDKVPVLLITSQRWSEFSQTWEFTDEFKNIKIPFIIVIRNPDVQVGTNQNSLWNIPGKPLYTHVQVPTWDGNRVGMSLYKIPQPTSVDVVYSVKLFTSKMRDLNKFSIKTQKKFNARQSYIYPNKHPQPLHLETISDESTITDFEERRFYIQNYEFLLKGYILDEDDFEIQPAVDRAVLFTELLIDDNVRPRLKVTLPKDSEGDGSISYNVIMNPMSVSEFDTKIEYSLRFTNLDILRNTNNVILKLDGEFVSVPFTANVDQNLEIIAVRDITKTSKFVLNGYLI